MSLQYGELRPTNGWDRFGSLGHPSKFQRVSRLGFVTAATSLTGGRLLGCYSIYSFSGALAPWRNFARCKIHFASESCVLLYWQRYCTALKQRLSAKLCGVVQGMELRNFRRHRHLYSAGRPSRSASAHILVVQQAVRQNPQQIYNHRKLYNKCATFHNKSTCTTSPQLIGQVEFGRNHATNSITVKTNLSGRLQCHTGHVCSSFTYTEIIPTATTDNNTLQIKCRNKLKLTVKTRPDFIDSCDIRYCFLIKPRLHDKTCCQTGCTTG